MANFDNLLKELHSNASSTSVSEDMDKHIIINSNRTFTLPEYFNTTIAYEGDVNS
jgi:hypothetical protein